MNISPASAPFAETPAVREQAAAARRRAADQDAAKALSSPRFKGAETAKTQARAKLDQIRERIKILKKLFSANPKEMARALAQVFKELKAAIKAYKEAGGSELSMSAAAVGAVMSAPAAGSEGAEKPAVPAVPAAGGASAYDAAVSQVRKTIAEDGLEFVKEVRDLSNALSDLLETARTQAAIKKRDKSMDQAFEDADNGLHELRVDMAAMERDIRNAVPEAGMRLSVAA